nr:carbon catabolite repressor protein 4 homolog 1-like [Ipomoea trifida]
MAVAVMAEPPHVRRRSSCVIVPCSEFETLVCVNDVGYEVSAVALESNADCAASASSDPSDIPIVGCELTPYVLLRLPDKSVATDDVPESAPINGLFLRYKWYRIQSDKKIAICSVHPSEQSTLQGLGCVNAKIPVAKSYHCSPKCFANSWQHHRVLHEHAANAVNKNGSEEEEVFGRYNSTGSDVVNKSLPPSQSTGNLANGAVMMSVMSLNLNVLF